MTGADGDSESVDGLDEEELARLAEWDEPVDDEDKVVVGTMAGPMDWWALSPDAQTVVLAGLSVWVARLVRTFQIEWTEIPPWWYRHEGFIHELLALRQSREQVAYDPAEAESAPLTWLHNLSLTRNRLRALRSALGGDYHNCPEPQPQEWARANSEEHQTWRVSVQQYAFDMARKAEEER